MKNFKNIVLFSLFVLSIIVFFNGCKGFGSPDYTMTVVLEDGCTGTPDAGTYIHKEFDKIEYEYKPPKKGVAIEVLVNNNDYEKKGEIQIYNNVNIVVRIKDIRGIWEFTYKTESENDIKMDITFSGKTPFEGDFTDSRGYKGTWTVKENDFTMTYSNWHDYIFTGSIKSMRGNYTGEGVELSWSAKRKN